MTSPSFIYLFLSMMILSLVLAWGLAIFLAYCLVAVNPRDDDP
jgi:hypothetical protein